MKSFMDKVKDARVLLQAQDNLTPAQILKMDMYEYHKDLNKRALNLVRFNEKKEYNNRIKQQTLDLLNEVSTEYYEELIYVDSIPDEAKHGYTINEYINVLFTQGTTWIETDEKSYRAIK